MLAPKAFAVWLGLLQLDTQVEGFVLRKPSFQAGRSEYINLKATQGFGSSTNPSVDKKRQKSIDGLQEWAKEAGIL